MTSISQKLAENTIEHEIQLVLMRGMLNFRVLISKTLFLAHVTVQCSNETERVALFHMAFISIKSLITCYNHPIFCERIKKSPKYI